LYFQLIDEFLSQDWTMEMPDIPELPKAEVDALRRLMLDQHIHMSFNERL
jgi:hypothetical protein